jgi:hypothetical protein
MLSLNIKLAGCEAGLSIFPPWPDYIWHLNFVGCGSPQPNQKNQTKRATSGNSGAFYFCAQSDASIMQAGSPAMLAGEKPPLMILWAVATGAVGEPGCHSIVEP